MLYSPYINFQCGTKSNTHEMMCGYKIFFLASVTKSRLLSGADVQYSLLSFSYISTIYFNLSSLFCFGLLLSCSLYHAFFCMLACTLSNPEQPRRMLCPSRQHPRAKDLIFPFRTGPLPGFTISFSGRIPVIGGNGIPFRNFGEFRRISANFGRFRTKFVKF